MDSIFHFLHLALRVIASSSHVKTKYFNMIPKEATGLISGTPATNPLSGELPPPTAAPSSPVDDDPHSPLQGFAIGE